MRSFLEDATAKTSDRLVDIMFFIEIRIIGLGHEGSSSLARLNPPVDWSDCGSC